MRGLAEYAMSSRYRALLVAVAGISSLVFGWIGAGLVALVTLRRGYQEGFWLLLWALLPAMVVTYLTGDSSVLLLLIGTAVLAAVLRATVNLSLAALFTPAIAVVTGVAMLAFGQGLLAELEQSLGDLIRAMQSQAAAQAGTQSGNSGNAGALPALAIPTQLQLAGMMGTANGALCFMCLCLGRYWQSALYNPGGFGAEFRALRYPPALVLVLIAAALALSSVAVSYRSWAIGALLPVVIAGFALLHAWVRARSLSSSWLVLAYVMWTLANAMKLAMIGAVVVDALLDLRQRWNSPSALSPHEDDASDENDENDENDDKDQT